MHELLRTLAIFVGIVGASILGACTLLDVKLENGLVNLYDDNPLPAAGVAMPIAGRDRQPVGHYEYCLRFTADCEIVASDPRPTALTRERWAELVKINNQVNSEVRPHPKDKDGRSTDKLLYDAEDYWTYPDSYGDCEDYVLAKRWELMQLGWPASSLLIALANQPVGGGHAVLVVRTDRGDFVLDNLNHRILAWNRTPYRFYGRQSEYNSGKWREVIDPRDLTKVAATN